MQKVSKAYKESMKSSLRERAYIMISFGLVNQEAQAKATVDNGSYAYSNNPIPRVKYKEALQIIANACRCVLTQSRDR